MDGDGKPRLPYTEDLHKLTGKSMKISVDLWLDQKFIYAYKNEVTMDD